MAETPPSGAALLNDRGIIRISGSQARGFLQGLISNNMERVSAECALYGALLTPQGKFLYDFFIVEKEDAFLLDCDGGARQSLFKRLMMYKLRAQIELEDVTGDFHSVALIGEAATRFAGDKTEPGQAWEALNGIAFIDPRLAAMGSRLILPRDSAEDQLRKAGLPILEPGAYTAHRLALGVPQGGADILYDKAFLLESNFDELHGVDHHKGCYIGQETTSRTKRKGSLRKRLLPVDVEGPLPAPGTDILAGDMVVGTVHSGQGARAIALIRLERAQKARQEDLALTAGDATLHIVTPDWISL